MIKLADTLAPMSEFPAAMAEHIGFSDGATLQEKFDNKELGGGDDSVTLTQQEYEALSEEEKLDGLYYTYDTKRIYKNGIQYGASEPIPLTMEEYKALKEAGAIDEQQEYLIEANTEGILLGAEDIGYNNAESGIQATTVQGAIDKVVETVEDNYAKKTDIPTTLPANGGNADTVNNHTVETDVPVDAKFTDTVYDDTEVKGSIEELNEVIRSYFYPTGAITDIEVGENGDKYIAPSDGFVQVTISGIGYVSIITSNAANSASINSSTDNIHRIKTFVKKDEKFSVYYSIADKSLMTLKHYALV